MGDKLRATTLIRVDNDIYARIKKRRDKLIKKDPLATMNDALKDLLGW